MKIKALLLCIISAVLFIVSFFVFTPHVSAAQASRISHDYSLVYQSPYPSTLKPNDTTNVYIEIKNTGSSPWLNNGNVITRLGSGSQYGSSIQQRDYISEFANSNWPSPNRPAALKQAQINPGENATFQFDIKVPSAPGIYKAYFTPVVDGVSWMKDMGIFWQIEVVGSAPQTNVQAKSLPNNSIDSISASVAKVICREDAAFTLLSQGSGTLFKNTNYKYTSNPFYLTTNLHVVKTKDGSIPKCVIQVFNNNQGGYSLYKADGYKSFGDGIDFAIIDIQPWERFEVGDMVYDQIASYAGISYSRYNFAGIGNLSKNALNDTQLSGGAINTGEQLTLLGYPSYGGKNITITQGINTGLTNYLGNDYIKTNAKVGPGLSGGLAINSAGKLIGIPSMMVKNSDSSTIGYILYFHNLAILN